MSKSLLWAKKSIFLFTVPLLVPPALLEFLFAEATLMLQKAFFIWVAQLIITLVFSFTSVVGHTPGFGNP